MKVDVGIGMSVGIWSFDFTISLIVKHLKEMYVLS